MKKEKFHWDPETGTATCTVEFEGKVYKGVAKCHPDDRDFMSEKTGLDYAFSRARIAALKDYKHMLTAQLKAMKQFYYSINMSKKFNPKSYESKMLRRQLHLLENDLTTAKELLFAERLNLNNRIKAKDIFYKHTRIRRTMDTDTPTVDEAN